MSRFEIVDALDRRHGPFKTAKALVAYVGKRFRFQQQDDERTGRYPTGYDVRLVQPKAKRRRSAPKIR